MKKIIIIYDATLLIVGFKSGLYNVAFNLLVALLKCRQFNIVLYFKSNIKSEKIKELLSSHSWEHLPFTVGNSRQITYFEECKSEKYMPFFKKVINKLLAYMGSSNPNLDSDISSINTDNNIVFFSPLFIAPDCYLKSDKVPKYLILYDTIPHYIKNEVPPEKFTSGWYAESLNSFESGTSYFAISENTKNDFLKFGINAKDELIRVFPLAADKKIFYRDKMQDKNNKIRAKYGIPLEKKYVLSLCSLEPHKNLIFTTRCFLEFISDNKINDLVFVIAGSNATGRVEALNKLNSIIETNSAIYLTGYVDKEDLSSLYSNAECFVFNSLYEGFGLPPLEAMQCGTPVIASDRSSIPEVVGNAARLINPESVEELKCAFKEMYYDDCKKADYSNNGVKRSELFSWDKSAKIITNYILSDMGL